MSNDPYQSRGVRVVKVHPTDSAQDRSFVDIIAIHGLDTKSPETWTWINPMNKAEQMNWLCDPSMLPASVENARIFTCDWPADIFQPSNSVPWRIEEIARHLLASIIGRDSGSDDSALQDRPILFIASCLGGIILMQALVKASQSPEYKSISTATRGIIFLATPFGGTSFQDVARWAELVLSSTAYAKQQCMSNMTDCVIKPNLDVQELVTGFTEIYTNPTHPCDIMTFYETKKTDFKRWSTLGLNKNKQVGYTFYELHTDCICAKLHKLVGRQSGTLEMVANPLPLNRNHLLMNKFRNAQDEDYQMVAQTIKRFLRNIRMGTADHWIRVHHYSDEYLRIERLSGQTLDTKQCYINLAIVKRNSVDGGNAVGLSTHEQARHSAMTRSYMLRLQTPGKNEDISLSQIFNPPGPGRSAGAKRILIRGRAGVGKTTLCKKIVHDFTRHGTWRELFDRVLWLPLRRLKNWENSAGNYEELLRREFFNGCKIPQRRDSLVNDMCRLMESDPAKTLFILDGLDEVSTAWNDHDQRSRFLLDLFKQPYLIVTSRPYGQIPEFLCPDYELETIGFRPSQVYDYVHSVFGGQRSEAQAVELFLREHPDMEDLMRIPIQLDALCCTWESFDRKHPVNTMTAIYRAIEESLWRRDLPHFERHRSSISESGTRFESRSSIEKLVKEEKSFLAGLAFTGHNDNIIEFQSEHIELALDCFAPSLLLSQVFPRLSFLRASHPFEDYDRTCHFIHLTYQEYFAAQYFAECWLSGCQLKYLDLRSQAMESIDPRIFLQRNKYVARFDIMWRFVAGLLSARGKASGFFEEIESKPLDLLGLMHQQLAMHCLSEVEGEFPIRMSLERRLCGWLKFEPKFPGWQGWRLLTEAEFPDGALVLAFSEAPPPLRILIMERLFKRPSIPLRIVELVFIELENDIHGRNAASFLSRQRTLPCEIVEALAKKLVHQDHVVRRTALAAMSSVRQLPEHVLLTGLADEDSTIQEIVENVIRNQEALSIKVLEVLASRLTHSSPQVRGIALKALQGRSKLPDNIIRIIVEQLRHDEAHVREAAFYALKGLMPLPHNILWEMTSLLHFSSPGDARSFHYMGELLHKLAQSDICLRYVEQWCLNTDLHVLDVLSTSDSGFELPRKIANVLTTRLAETPPRLSKGRNLVRLLSRHKMTNKNRELVSKHLDGDDNDAQQVALHLLSGQTTLSITISDKIAAYIEPTRPEHCRCAIEALSCQSNVSAKYSQRVLECIIDDDPHISSAALDFVRRQSVYIDDGLAKKMTILLRSGIWVSRFAAINTMICSPCLGFTDDITRILTSWIENGDALHASTCCRNQSAVPGTILKALSERMKHFDAFTKIGALRVLAAQSTLPGEVLGVLIKMLQWIDYDPRVTSVSWRMTRQKGRLVPQNVEVILREVEKILRKHKEFYIKLLRSSHRSSLYQILLETSLGSTISWCVEDGYSVMRTPDGIIRFPVDDEDKFVKALIKKRPAGLPRIGS